MTDETGSPLSEGCELPDADNLLDVIAAVGERHRAAGHPDPFDGCTRSPSVAPPLVTGLRALVVEARAGKAPWPDLIEQFRLLVLDGDRLTPRSVRVLTILLRPGMAAADSAPLREWGERRRSGCGGTASRWPR